jgi:RNA polymerase sigma-70 factor, ECF subfamily
VARFPEPIARESHHAAACEVALRQARKLGCNEGCPLGVRHVEVESATLTWVAKSEELGFEEFFRAEYSGLVRSLYLLTADLLEAEELAQEAMARVFERWDRVEVMESAAGYVYRTAVNLNRKRLRHLAVRARRILAMPSRGDEGSELETRADFASAMGSLPVGQRQAFMLTEWLGLSAEEAGQMLGVAPSSVRSRVHRAKTTLRKLLEVSVEDRG